MKAQSIISYLTARPSRDIVAIARQLITLEWWELCKDNFDVFVSQATISEISRGDADAAKQRLTAIALFPSLATSPEAQELAKQLIASNAVPPHRVDDALHIALAASCGADYLLTWNFKFISNAMAKPLIQKTVAAGGFICPTICTPEQLYTEGMEDDAILKELREHRKAIAEKRAAQPSPPPSP